MGAFRLPSRRVVTALALHDPCCEHITHLRHATFRAGDDDGVAIATTPDIDLAEREPSKTLASALAPLLHVHVAIH